LICYLDSNVVMYFVENHPRWGAAAAARIAGLRSAGDTFAVSDLTRFECRVGPLRDKNAAFLSDFDAFFASPDVHVLSLTAAVCDRGAVIRATHALKSLDALHLAAAIEARCDLFLPNDNRLSGFPDLSVEVLS
jgi:predicted nucleic acid-binding protein